jgi:adenylate cyclase
MGKDDLGMLCKFIYRLPKMAGTETVSLRSTATAEIRFADLAAFFLAFQVDESAFDSFEHVDLSGRDIQIFPIFLHRHAGSIIHLNLSKNQLQELPSDFIQDCVNLRELKLSNMALKRVPPSIRQSSSLTRLDVSCNRIGDLDMAGFEAIPGLMSLKLQNNRLAVLPSYFGHLRALKYLNISNNNFEAFPSIVCEIKSLVDLDLSFNGIAYLPPEIGKLTNLDRLVLVGNVITTLPQEFTKLENLRELDCRRNRIADFTHVYALSKLEVLRAERNEVKLIEAQFGPKMTDVNLSHNSITRLSFSLRVTDPSSGLTSLDLSHAKLSSIAEEVVSQLQSLVILKLDGNQFTRLPEGITNLVNLRELHATDNSLSALPVGIDRLRHIEVINVHNNNLTAIPVQIWSCGRLVSLNASSNLIDTFPDPPEEAPPAIPAADGENGSSPPAVHDLQALGKSLRSLQLCDNRLTDDVFHPVSLLTVLRTLNLSFNEILEVPPWTLRKNSALTALYLSGNKLTSLPSEDLEKLRSLMILHVNGNKLQSLPAELSNMHRLTVLDVGSNVLKYNINNWRYDWNWCVPRACALVSLLCCCGVVLADPTSFPGAGFDPPQDEKHRAPLPQLFGQQALRDQAKRPQPARQHDGLRRQGRLWLELQPADARPESRPDGRHPPSTGAGRDGRPARADVLLGREQYVVRLRRQHGPVRAPAAVGPRRSQLPRQGQ